MSENQQIPTPTPEHQQAMVAAGNGHDGAQSQLTLWAADPNIDPVKLRLLWELYQDDIKLRDRPGFQEAMRRAQSRYPVVPHDSRNPQTGSTFAGLPAMWELCAPIWTSEGLHVGFQSGQRENRDIWAEMHVSWGNYTHVFTCPDAPSDKQGARGTINKTDIQGNQSTVTYLKRGLCASGMGIVTAREDDDGESGHRERRPPPTQRTERNAEPPWKINLARGEKVEVDRLIANFAAEAVAARLEETWTLVEESVNKAPPDARTLVLTALAEARKRLAKQKMMGDFERGEARRRQAAADAGRTEPNDDPGFEFPLYDPQGNDTDGELFRDPLSWARAFMMTQWDQYQHPADRENLLHHNANAIAEARRLGPQAATILEEAVPPPESTPAPAASQTPPAGDLWDTPIEPMVFEAVQPIEASGKPDWAGWLRALRDDLATLPAPEDLPGWTEAQRGVLEGAPYYWRHRGISSIQAAHERNGQTLSDWFARALLPTAPYEAETLRAINAMVAIDGMAVSPQGKQQFDALVASIKPEMNRLRQHVPEVFAIVLRKFDAKNKAFADAQQG